MSLQTEQLPDSAPKPLRIWPLGLVTLLQIGLIIFWLTPAVNNLVRFLAMMIGPALCGLAYTLLLLLGTRINPRSAMTLLAAVVVLAVTVGVTAAPRSGIGVWLFGIPGSLIICTLSLAVLRKRRRRDQVRSTIACICVGWLFLGMSRIDGIDGSYQPEFSWRWVPTSEEELVSSLKQQNDVKRSNAESDWIPSKKGWSGFRGPNRDSRVTDLLEPQDWREKPPEEVWRRPVGPGWSSMAIVSGRLFTQEQRGKIEACTCYDAMTGQPIWSHEEISRFEEVVSGAGPRATPTVIGGRVYTLGANAVLLALNAADGRVIWRRDLLEEYNASLPVWGFSASPLVTEDLVTVFVGGKNNDGLISFDTASGREVWSVESPAMNFSSAQLMELQGEQQIVFVEPKSIRGLQTATGKELWRADVINERDFPMVQPQQIDQSSLVAATGDGKDVIRVSVEKKDKWVVNETWQSRSLKPSFNDFLYYKGFLYGFDKQIFACVDASNGERRWKNGRYGFGQAILLESIGQIIVASESGELVLLAADSNELKELGKLSALSSKTWNHPAVESGYLYVRNAEEMVCYRLAQ